MWKKNIWKKEAFWFWIITFISRKYPMFLYICLKISILNKFSWQCKTRLYALSWLNHWTSSKINRPDIVTGWNMFLVYTRHLDLQSDWLIAFCSFTTWGSRCRNGVICLGSTAWTVDFWWLLSRDQRNIFNNFS